MTRTPTATNRPSTGQSAVSESRAVKGSSASKGDGLDFLRRQNPKLDELIKQVPGLDKYLASQVKKGTVSQGPAQGEVETPIRWNGWNHSEQTSQTYHHGMKDEQILNQDVIVAYQIEPGGKALDGMRGNQGTIIGIYNLGQLGVRRCTYDGGWYFDMNVTAHGKKGEQQDVAFSIVALNANGAVRGGGHPARKAANDPNYTKTGEWGGRRWTVTHGTPFTTRMVE